MKYVIGSVGFIVAILIFTVADKRLAAERIEVVELHTGDNSSQVIKTSPWIGDDDNRQYLWVGSDGSGWHGRLKGSPSVLLTRNGQTVRFNTFERPEKRALITGLMREK